MAKPTTRSIHLPPADAAELIDSGGAEVVDVRRDWEWEAGHLEHARHVEGGLRAWAHAGLPFDGEVAEARPE